MIFDPPTLLPMITSVPKPPNYLVDLSVNLPRKGKTGRTSVVYLNHKMSYQSISIFSLLIFCNVSSFCFIAIIIPIVFLF